MAGSHRASRLSAPVALAAACLLIVAAVLLEPLLRGRLSTKTQEERVQVTGLSLPSEDDEDWLVYTDRGTFSVGEEIRARAQHDNPAFLFRIGQSYRIQVHGAGVESLLGTFHPVIEDAQPVSPGLAGSDRGF